MHNTLKVFLRVALKIIYISERTKHHFSVLVDCIEEQKNLVFVLDLCHILIFCWQNDKLIESEKLYFSGILALREQKKIVPISSYFKPA